MRVNRQQREAFGNALFDALHGHGVTLLSATLGRDERNNAFWKVVMQSDTGCIVSQAVTLPAAELPYSHDALATIRSQLLKRLSRGDTESD